MPYVIPVFIPHQGCPHTCIFCNQFRISGSGEHHVTAEQVREIVSLWLSRRSPGTGDDGVQVAFYGGSFTGMTRSRQEELLDAVRPFLDNGEVATIRLSTRPDYVDDATPPFLRRHGVGVVELGVQSLDPDVLAASNRGHSDGQSVEAVRILQDGGMQVGVQLMLGLPHETTGSLRRTVARVISLDPDFVRIYPVLVLQKSGLAIQYEQGEYKPLSLGKAVVLSAWMKNHFDGSGIRVVRMGLQPGPDLEKNLLAGPYHPAFGEMVNARIMLKRTRMMLQHVPRGERVTLSISDRDQSVFRGVGSDNMRRLRELGLLERFDLVTDKFQPRHTIKKIEAEGNPVS